MRPFEETTAYSLLLKFERSRQRTGIHAAAADLCPLPAFICDHSGSRVLYVNDAYRRLAVLAANTAHSAVDLFAIVHPDDRAAAAIDWNGFTEAPVNGSAARFSWRYMDAATDGIVPAVTQVTQVVGVGIVGYIILSTTQVGVADHRLPATSSPATPVQQAPPCGRTGEGGPNQPFIG